MSQRRGHRQRRWSVRAAVACETSARALGLTHPLYPLLGPLLLQVLTTKRLQRKTAAALALHRKQALLNNFPPSAVEDRIPPAAQVVVQQPPPTTIGEAGVPIFRTATTTNSAGLFLVWPRNGTDLSTSSL